MFCTKSVVFLATDTAICPRPLGGSCGARHLPVDVPMACETPQKSANSRSKFATFSCMLMKPDRSMLSKRCVSQLISSFEHLRSKPEIFM